METPAHIPEVSVIVPVYNDKDSLPSVIEGIRKAMSGVFDTEIIVVDDGSTDGLSPESVRGAVRFHRHSENMGYGAAIKTGLRHALGSFLVIMDADGTYPPEAIPALVRALDDCDMSVGARTGATVHIPLVRQPAKWVLNRLANFLAGRRIPDLNSGLRAFRKSEAERFLHLLPSGFSLTTTLTLAFLCDDLRVVYMPIDYHRRKGKSKIRPLRDTKNILFTIVRTVVYFNPLKVFLPLGMIFFILALAVLVFSGLFLERVMDGTVAVLTLSAVQLASMGILADLITRRSGR